MQARAEPTARQVVNGRCVSGTARLRPDGQRPEAEEASAVAAAAIQSRRQGAKYPVRLVAKPVGVKKPTQPGLAVPLKGQ
jgi:hypothetical protein